MNQLFLEIKDNEEILSKMVIIIYRYGNFIYYKVKIPVIRQILYLIYKIIDVFVIKFCLGSEIPAKVKIGRGLVIYHPFGIILNHKCTIGNYVVLRHQVTIGNNGKNDKSPIIGDYVDIGAGAKIIGDILVKNGSEVGANAVVNKNFDTSGLLVGVPAILKMREGE